MFEASRHSKQQVTNSSLSSQVLLERLAAGGIIELDRWWISLDDYGSQVLCRHPHGIDVALHGFNLATCDFILKMIAGEHSPRSWTKDLSNKLNQGSEGGRQAFQAGGFGPALCPVR